jgi:triosephosphate isomerase
MRRTLIAGNWKMNLTTHEASTLLHRLGENIVAHKDVEVVLAPSLLSLQPLSVELDHRKFKLATQNAYYKDNGAYTGEVSYAMLHGLVRYAIIGHSERRRYFGDTLEVVREKVAAAVRNRITPILCIGETQQERKDGETKQVIHDQLTTALQNVTSSDIENFVIAYEPVWAIGTGVTAKPEQIEESIRFIRHNIRELYGDKAAETVRVLYGAGVEPDYVSGLLDLKCGVDGLLVGGASLNYHKFSEIVAAAQKRHYK